MRVKRQGQKFGDPDSELFGATTRLPQYPLPEESPHADHDVADLDTLPNPFPLHLDTVGRCSPMQTSRLSSSTLSTSLAWNADHIELEKHCTYEGTGEPMRQGVVTTVAEGEDEQEFGGIGDRYTSGSEEGLECQDEPPETTHEGNKMDVDTTSTHITAAQAHSLLITNPTYEEIVRYCKHIGTNDIRGDISKGYPDETQVKQRENIVIHPDDNCGTGTKLSLYTR
ncbi:hypothetical protein F5051DRAFT_470324 [Lentinula edodes]|nr:hypothetical protein F5051DRAFT_470324 [Lentinula edodes]